MKTKFIYLAFMLLLAGCNRPADQGAAESTATGRGTNSGGDVGGNGKVYDRGKAVGPPGSGRLDQGGGVTSGYGTNSVIWTNAETGTTNRGPATGSFPR